MLPSVNRRLSTTPDTRARTSAVRIASTRAGSSVSSATGWNLVVITPTCGGGILAPAAPPGPAWALSLDPQADSIATATRVQAAILVRDREEEWAERIQCFLLVEKRTKPCRSTSLVLLYGFIAGFWKILDILSRVYV